MVFSREGQSFFYFSQKMLGHPGISFDLYQGRENVPGSLHASALS